MNSERFCKDAGCVGVHEWNKELRKECRKNTPCTNYLDARKRVKHE